MKVFTKEVLMDKLVDIRKQYVRYIADVLDTTVEDIAEVWRETEAGANPMILKVVFKDGTDQKLIIKASEGLQ